MIPEPIAPVGDPMDVDPVPEPPVAIADQEDENQQPLSLGHKAFHTSRKRTNNSISKPYYARNL